MAVSQSPLGGVSDSAEGVARDWLTAIFILRRLVQALAARNLGVGRIGFPQARAIISSCSLLYPFCKTIPCLEGGQPE